jgi:hypothetical protein
MTVILNSYKDNCHFAEKLDLIYLLVCIGQEACSSSEAPTLQLDLKLLQFALL